MEGEDNEKAHDDSGDGNDDDHELTMFLLCNRLCFSPPRPETVALQI